MRIFVHPALKTPVAKPVQDWLSGAGSVGPLMQAARQMASLEAEVLSLLPPGLGGGVAVGGVLALDPLVSIELVEEFLDVVQAHCRRRPRFRGGRMIGQGSGISPTITSTSDGPLWASALATAGTNCPGDSIRSPRTPMLSASIT